MGMDLTMLERAAESSGGRVTSLSPPVKSECEALERLTNDGLLDKVEEGDGFFAPMYVITEKGREFLKANIPPAEW